MTDNEIIKALEHCTAGGKGCNGCPLNDMPMDCIKSLVGYALDLIRRQQAEIERLKAEITRNEVKLLKIEKLHNEQKAIADSRKLDMDYFINENERLYSEIEKAKTEAITEFAERLKSEAVEARCCTFSTVVRVADINTLVKEMTEGDNGEQIRL